MPTESGNSQISSQMQEDLENFDKAGTAKISSTKIESKHLGKRRKACSTVTSLAGAVMGKKESKRFLKTKRINRSPSKQSSFSSKLSSAKSKSKPSTKKELQAAS